MRFCPLRLAPEQILSTVYVNVDQVVFIQSYGTEHSAIHFHDGKTVVVIGSPGAIAAELEGIR